MASDLVVERRSPLPVAAEAAFAWHGRPGALERLIPPWLHIEVLQRAELSEGSTAKLLIHAGPFAIHWTARHTKVEPGRGFSDFQVQGPFDRWKHSHRFEPAPDGTSILHDRIEADLPLGMRPGRAWVKRELERILAYRHAVTAADLAMHARDGIATGPAGPRDDGVTLGPRDDDRLHVAITGASGFIGSMLVPLLTTGGHRVTRLVRHPAGEGEIHWDPAGKGLDPQALSGVDTVIHLSGENLAARWTAERKRAILESRRTGTRLLVEAMTRAANGPRVFISTSAIGFYGDRGDEPLTEESASGGGFLAEVCRAWEAATEPAGAAGIRVVRVRIGLPLSPAGGMLQPLLLPFRLGLGGRIGSGEQWWSWISADDLLAIFHRVLTDPTLHGVVNAVAPNPVRQADFAKQLAKTLGRPAFLPVPATALKLGFGQMAEETILASARVQPAVLERIGHRFRHETLSAALAHELGRSP